MTKKMKKINELLTKYARLRLRLGIGPNSHLKSKKINLRFSQSKSDRRPFGGGSQKNFSHQYNEQLILKTNKMNDIIKQLRWRYSIRRRLVTDKFVFFMDIYHNKNIKTPYLTVTQIKNSEATVHAQMKLVFKKRIKSHKWADIRVVLIEFLKQINEFDYILISDRESSWVNMIQKELRAGDLSEQFLHCAGRFFCLKGAKNTPFKEPLQPRDPKPIEKIGLKQNTIEILLIWINKQITKLEKQFERNFDRDTQIIKLREFLNLL
jgi:hypothetical protein